MDETRKERGILFSAEMVLAILAGRKLQTRRLVKGNPANVFPMIGRDNLPNGEFFVSRPDSDRVGNSGVKCPHGVPGDRLWVRETIRLDWTEPNKDWGGERAGASYVADGAPTKLDCWGWQRSVLPSIHCPRGLSRLTLEITEVRVQRLQDISEEDARAEGVEADDISKVGLPAYSARQNFERLWDRINGKRAPWESSPWVWAISFRRIPQETNP